jgi:hypothetical protein
VRIPTSQDEGSLSDRIFPEISNQFRVKHLLSKLMRDVKHSALGSSIGIREPMNALGVHHIIEQLDIRG